MSSLKMDIKLINMLIIQECFTQDNVDLFTELS